MGAYTNNLDWEVLRTLDSATLAGAYLALGTPLLHPSYILKIVNGSTSIITVSRNGTSDIDVVLAGGTVEYNEGKGQEAYQLSAPQGTQFYVKGTAGTGLIYLVSQYIVLR